MSYIPTISEITNDLQGTSTEAEYARRVITAAAVLNAHRSMMHRMASFHIPFSSQLDKTMHEAWMNAESIAFEIGKNTSDVRTDINRQAFLLLHKMSQQYVDQIK